MPVLLSRAEIGDTCSLILFLAKLEVELSRKKKRIIFNTWWYWCCVLSLFLRDCFEFDYRRLCMRCFNLSLIITWRDGGHVDALILSSGSSLWFWCSHWTRMAPYHALAWEHERVSYCPPYWQFFFFLLTFSYNRHSYDPPRTRSPGCAVCRETCCCGVWNGIRHKRWQHPHPGGQGIFDYQWWTQPYIPHFRSETLWCQD